MQTMFLSRARRRSHAVAACFHRLLLMGLLLFPCALAVLPVASDAQDVYYQTVSKHCESCGQAVSINSRVGQRCPHCGVIWGRENRHYSRHRSASKHHATASHRKHKKTKSH